MMSNTHANTNPNAHPIVLAITGASGAIYAARLLEWLLRLGYRTHLMVSNSGAQVIRQELAVDIPGTCDFDSIIRFLQTARTRLNDPLETSEVAGLSSVPIDELLSIHPNDDYFAPIASGSYLTRGMVICPCSGATLSAVSRSASENLIQRAAEVHLKERRPLLVVPRETPVSTIQLENMLRLSRTGAVVLPASPGWYHGVRHISGLVDFLVARILDQLGIDNTCMPRWPEGQ